MPCHGIQGLFQHPEVRIGWAPYVAITDTEIRSNPGGGTLLKEVPKGAGVGWQSVRNPTGDPHPRLRLEILVNGAFYTWVYSRAGTKTGWIRVATIDPDRDSANKPPLLGPGGLDFEIGRTLPLEKKPSSCGTKSLKKPLRRVHVRDTYLRYSERGTAFHYLHKGDVVRMLTVNAAHGFGGCEVVSCGPLSGVHVGSRGFVMQESLEPLDV